MGRFFKRKKNVLNVNFKNRTTDIRSQTRIACIEWRYFTVFSQRVDTSFISATPTIRHSVKVSLKATCKTNVWIIQTSYHRVERKKINFAGQGKNYDKISSLVLLLYEVEIPYVLHVTVYRTTDFWWQKNIVK